MLPIMPCDELSEVKSIWKQYNLDARYNSIVPLLCSLDFVVEYYAHQKLSKIHYHSSVFEIMKYKALYIFHPSYTM